MRLRSARTGWAIAAKLLTAALAFLALQVAEASAATPYPLDGIERIIPARGKVRCPRVDKVFYRGKNVRYHSRVFVNKHFKKRLELFEKVVADVGREVYGRAPRRIRHIGTYNCRRIAAWPTFLSEHGLANGIDVSAFVFPRAKRAVRRSLPRNIRGAFKVSVLRHWSAKRPKDAIHQRFLRTLVQRLVDRGDTIFRVLVGPGYPGHDNHFHFDVAPWALIDFEPMPQRVGVRAGLQALERSSTTGPAEPSSGRRD